MQKHRLMCPVCDVIVEAQLVKEETLRKTYRCPQSPVNGDSHLFAKKTALGYAVSITTRIAIIGLVGDIVDLD